MNSLRLLPVLIASVCPLLAGPLSPAAQSHLDAKITHWSHAGVAKHDQPLQGKVWQGAPELDASTGLEQIQIAVPVLSPEQKPVGSLVVGIPVAKLE